MRESYKGGGALMRPATTGLWNWWKCIHLHDEFLPAQHDWHTNTKRKDRMFPHPRIQMSWCARLQLGSSVIIFICFIWRSFHISFHSCDRKKLCFSELKWQWAVNMQTRQTKGSFSQVVRLLQSIQLIPIKQCGQGGQLAQNSSLGGVESCWWRWVCCWVLGPRWCFFFFFFF